MGPVYSENYNFHGVYGFDTESNAAETVGTCRSMQSDGCEKPEKSHRVDFAKVPFWFMICS